MTTFRTNMTPGWLPDDYGQLLVRGIVADSLAFSVGQVIHTTSATLHLPVLTDATSAAFVAEGADLPLGDPTLGEVAVSPAKLAHMTVTSLEATQDASPEATAAIGSSLIRGIARKADESFVGNLAAPAPAGLAGLAGVSAVNATGDTLASLDIFASAISAIQVAGGQPTHVLVSPNIAKRLATLKSASGSIVPVLASDPTKPATMAVYGVPVVVFPTIPDTVLYVVDGSRIAAVIRQDAHVDVSTDRYFESARVAVRAIARLAWGFQHPATVAKVLVA